MVLCLVGVGVASVVACSGGSGAPGSEISFLSISPTASLPLVIYGGWMKTTIFVMNTGSPADPRDTMFETLFLPKAVFGCNGALSDGRVPPLVSSVAVITST